MALADGHRPDRARFIAIHRDGSSRTGRRQEGHLQRDEHCGEKHRGEVSP